MNAINRNILPLIFALAGLMLLCALPAAAQSDVILFDFPGSTLYSYTTLTGINAAGEIVGNENLTGIPRGFVLRPDGSITTVTVPPPSGETQGTILNGINNRGQMVGQSLSISAGAFHRTAFIMDADTIILFDVPGAKTTSATAIDDHGIVVGSYTDSAFNLHGFSRDRAGRLTLFDIPGTLDTYSSGINNHRQIVGAYSNENSIYHGFVLNPSGVITVIDAPGVMYTTTAAGINDNGEIVGWGDALGFLRSRDNTFRFFDVGPVDTFCSAINNRGTIVGGEDDENTTHGMILQPNTSLNMTAPPAQVGQPVSVQAVLHRAYDGLPVGGATIDAYIGQKKVGSAVTDSNGIASLNVSARTHAGTVLITCVFAGDSNGNNSRNSVAVEIDPADTTLTIQNASGKQGTVVTLKAMLAGASGNRRITGQTVQFLVNGVAVGSGVTANGMAKYGYTIPLGMPIGDATLTTQFAGSSDYNPSVSGNGVLIVRPHR